MKSALITGIAGQDAAYLSELLLNKGYKVFGCDIAPDLWRLRELGIAWNIKLLSADLTDMSSLIRALEKSEASEVYHLASQSFVGSSFDHPIAAGIVTGVGTTNLLEAVRYVNPQIKVYNAATSELYGDSLPPGSIATEDTPFRPASPYATAKHYSYEMIVLYREAYNMFACNGILFNHESEFRGLEFVTRKVTYGAARIKLGLQDRLFLGNTDAVRDWGYAKEYVEGMWKILQLKIPEDFILATNETHSVKELCERVFSHLGLNWQDHIDVHEDHMRPKEVNYLRGDYSKVKKFVGWEPKVRFEELIDMMTDADYERCQREQKVRI